MAEAAEKMPAVDSAKEEQGSSVEVPVNASGHRQELQRNYGLLSICALAITTGNTWIAQGGSIATALSNGGPSGVIYEFIAVSVCYWMVAASIAELASGMPSAGGGMIPRSAAFFRFG
jgi:amino acid permease